MDVEKVYEEYTELLNQAKEIKKAYTALTKEAESFLEEAKAFWYKDFDAVLTAKENKIFTDLYWDIGYFYRNYDNDMIEGGKK